MRSSRDWKARQRTPRMMRQPPRLATRLGAVEVSRLWTAKATTSSTQRRLATRLGEASCSDLVSVVKATSPDTDNPIKVAHCEGVMEATPGERMRALVSRRQ